MCKLSLMKIKIKLFNFLVLTLTLIALQLNAQIDSGVDFDLQGFINDKISAGETNIVVPPGRYRVSPNGNNYHLRFFGLDNITITADSVEMICTETVQAIQIERCENFTLKGLTIDYDPLPFTQGQIIELSEDKRTITANLIDGYSTIVKGSKLEIYDSLTGELSTTTYYGITYQVDVENRKIVVTKPSNYQLANSHEKIGDILVLDSEYPRHIPHAIVPKKCTDLLLENVRLYAGTTFGFFETECSGSQYLNCKIDRRPMTDEIIERGVRRMRSINADGFHSKHATIGPKYIECLARYNGDDGIAINGDYHVILSSNDNIVSVVGKGATLPNLSIGDTVELVSYTGERLQDAKVTAFNKGAALTSSEKEFLQNHTFYAEAANTYKASTSYDITLDRPVHLPLGSLIASANRIGNNFEVRNCTIGPNRSRGILVKSSNGIITGNILLGNRGHAIKLAPEYVWLEAGSGNNVIISDNVISECHSAAIAVYAEGGNGSTAPAGAHKNITITRNKISGSTNPAIALTSIKGLELENNTIDFTNNDLLVPWIKGDFGRNEDPAREIYMENVVIEPEVVGIQDENLIHSSGIKIYNNPFSDYLKLEGINLTDTKYTVYNITGRKMLSSSTGKQSVINTSDWNIGMYFLIVDGAAPVKLLKK